MTDYPTALAAAREAAGMALFDDSPKAKHACVEALHDLLAALDAARGEAVAWPKADDSDKELGWSWDYKWLESLADATRAAGWDASMEAIDFVLSRVAAPQAPPAAVPAGYVPLAAAEALALEAMRVGNLGGHERTVEGHWSAEVGDRFEEFMFEEGFAMLAADNKENNNERQ